jgi:hypothetical protein
MCGGSGQGPVTGRAPSPERESRVGTADRGPALVSFRAVNGTPRGRWRPERPRGWLATLRAGDIVADASIDAAGQ